MFEKHFIDIRNKCKNGGNIEKIMEEEYTLLYGKINAILLGCVVTKDEADIIDGKIPGKTKIQSHIHQ